MLLCMPREIIKRDSWASLEKVGVGVIRDAGSFAVEVELNPSPISTTLFVEIRPSLATGATRC